jgi:inhibitor of KinA
VSDPRIKPAGDAAWFIELDERIDAATNEQAIGIAHAVRASALPGLRDVVTGYRGVAVYLDPLQTDAAGVEERLVEIARGARAGAEEAPPVVRVPVCYGGELGPDLPEVAAFAGCSEQEVVDRHTAVQYRVYMIGFVPGFPYMGTVDARIAMPRRESPRVRVPAGSVGIAGAQTGIYPTETPGGWRLIGRTPIRPFVADRQPPCLFAPGSRVAFEAISRDEFERWQD